MKRSGKPLQNDLVICKITKINPNSVFALILEYDLEGMIHIGEITSGWVKDIKHFVKPNQIVVCKVLNSREGITLSIKRVSEKQKKERLKLYSLEKRAEKWFEIAGSALGLSLEQSYEEIGFSLQEKFGSIYEVFRLSISNPEIVSAQIPEKWFTQIRDIAQKSITKKNFEFSTVISITSSSGQGINMIKEILKYGEKVGLDVSYIAAPKYLIRFTTQNAKRGEKEFSEKLGQLLDRAKQAKYETKAEIRSS